VLYVIAQFYFGYVSCFSGQPLYEPWIYQMYNIAFTSVPIMCYALFDLEHSKSELISKPQLYKEIADFTPLKFWTWFGYAFW
jgi:phospholipid-transporting ATPase